MHSPGCEPCPLTQLIPITTIRWTNLLVGPLAVAAWNTLHCFFLSAMLTLMLIFAPKWKSCSPMTRVVKRAPLENIWLAKQVLMPQSRSSNSPSGLLNPSALLYICSLQDILQRRGDISRYHIHGIILVHVFVWDECCSEGNCSYPILTKYN